MRHLRIPGEGRCAVQHEPQIGNQVFAFPGGMVAIASVGAGQERHRLLATPIIFQQPSTRHRRQHVIAVNHVVVEYRRVGPGSIGSQVIQNREFADVLLVCHLTLVR